ncbi:MAG: hypothetical protein AAF572_14450 [Cyanobacteria bacterium P01_B01_bin.77]
MSLQDPTVLILDDDELWLALHERRLKQAGFDTYTTDQSKEAINALKTRHAFKFALIDEILYVPPIPVHEEDGELQSLQGTGVIREVNKYRSDIQFIIVTSAVQKTGGADVQTFRREMTNLRRHPGVIDIIHKLDIQEDPEDSYAWLIDLLKRSKNTTNARVVTPKILVGLGFPREQHEAMAEQMELKRRQYMPIAPLLKKGGANKVLNSFWDLAKEKTLLLEIPGAKKPERLSIRPNSSAFKILSFLAQQTELNKEVLICDQDYEHARRRSKPKDDSVTAEIDDRAVRAFAYGYDSKHGRVGLNAGVQIEGGIQKNSPLKVAIHRLSKQLQEMNVGPSKKLFDFDGRGYKPTFDLGIVTFAVRSSKK